jgi:imidazolonepropionase-like amidohydrolase
MSQTLFTNVAIFDGTGSPAEGPFNLLVEGDRIAEITPAQTQRPGKGASEQVIDGTGCTLMPGMVFAHTHLGYHNVLGAREVLFKYPLTQLAFIAAANARRALQLGYTTMVGAGSICNLDTHLRAAIHDGLVVGPNLIPCSRDLMVAGPEGRRDASKVKHIPADYMPILTDISEFAAAVHKEIDDGAQIVKTFATGDDQFPNAKSEEPLYTLEELQTVVAVAAERGALVRSHARGRAGIEKAIAAGVDIVDHATYSDQSCLDGMLARGQTVVPSYYQPKMFLERGASFGLQPDLTEFAAEVANTRAFLPTAHEMGLNIALGDDFGFAWTPHGLYHDELEAFQHELGFSAATVLKWATLGGAQMIRQQDRIGTIAPGKQADLILVAGDPSRDVRALKTGIRAVMRSGALAA